ncbi:Gustatory receptor 15, partial [Frankliniella occidentalis]
ESFLSVANRSLRDRWPSHVRNLRWGVIILFVFVGVGSIAGPFYAETEFGNSAITFNIVFKNMYYYIPSAYVSITSSTLFFMFTITYFQQLHEAAIALGEHLDQLRPGDTAGVRRAQKLWVSLRALFNDRPSFYLLDVFFMSQLFAMLLLSVSLWYDLSSAKMLVSASTQVIWMFVLSFQAYRMSDLAHGAVSAMHGPVTAALDRLSMDARDEHFHRAVLLFYMSVSSRPAHLSLSGFANIDRPLFTSIVSLTVTYLIILMQFRTDVSQQ